MLEIVSSDKLLGTVGQADKPKEQLEATPSVIKAKANSSTYQSKNKCQNREVTSSKINPSEKLDSKNIQKREVVTENKDSILVNTRFKVSDAVSKNEVLKPKAIGADLTSHKKGKIIKEIHQNFHICFFRGDSDCSGRA